MLVFSVFRLLHQKLWLIFQLFLLLVISSLFGSVLADALNISSDLRDGMNPAIRVNAAAEHNVIRRALNDQTTLNNLGYSLSETYDFALQPRPTNALLDFEDSQLMQHAAGQHAGTCTFAHLNNSHGQNLFAGTGTSWTIEHAVNSWADEARYYDYDEQACTTGKLCGHYTQIVAEISHEVGCAIQHCNQMIDSTGNAIFEGRSGVLIACYYDPHGNIIGRQPYVKSLGSDLVFKMKVMLQGSYQVTENTMSTAPVNRDLPEIEPYSNLGHTVSGNKRLGDNVLQGAADDGVVDWILVELRDSSIPSRILEAKAFLLHRDGSLINADDGSDTLKFEEYSPGDYYLAVRHHNHLGVMTGSPISLSGSATTVDFSSSSTPVWGQSARFEYAERALLWAGDVNHDGRVIGVGAENDVGEILSTVLLDSGNSGHSVNYVRQGHSHADLNLDGKVIFAGANNDVNLIRGNVLIHPENTLAIGNFIISQQIP